MTRIRFSFPASSSLFPIPRFPLLLSLKFKRIPGLVSVRDFSARRGNFGQGSSRNDPVSERFVDQTRRLPKETVVAEFIVIRVLVPSLPIITRNHVRSTTTRHGQLKFLRRSGPVKPAFSTLYPFPL